VQAANVFAAEFLDSPSSRLPMPLTSFPAWLGHSIVKPMFVNNLRCRFLPLLAWLPAPSGPVLASLPKEFGWLENLSIVFFYQNLFLSNEHLLNVHKSI
jgi:hypothetical protein